MAVRLHTETLPREYKDLDFATSKKGSGPTQTLLRDLGYDPHVGFNAMNAKERLLFFDDPHARQVDVFVGSFRMCHEIPLERRLDLEPHTVPLAELLLTKLQIIELNEKDVRDAVALLSAKGVSDDDSEVNGARVAELTANDWGLWRTITRNLASVAQHLGNYDVDGALVQTRLDELQKRIEDAPKSRAWKLRDKIGERKRWYELPEEVGGV
ncbi:MAG TPA: hypothetical protein VHQ89_06815 [Gaiellaceae bacterium]|nr:hypothetical protein [Gaiellaceae bacterium]